MMFATSFARRALHATAALAFALFASPAFSAGLPGPEAGRPAPAFRLTTIDGRTVTLATYRGKTLVINVWGSWCPPCRLETPDLVAESKLTARDGVVFLGVNSTEPAAAVRAFVAAKGIPYAQAVVKGDSAFVRDYAITNYPTTIVIDPHGIVRALHADNILPRAQLQAYATDRTIVDIVAAATAASRGRRCGGGGRRRRRRERHQRAQRGAGHR